MPMPFLEITSKRFSENSPWAPSGVYSVHSLYRPVFTLTGLYSVFLSLWLKRFKRLFDKNKKNNPNQHSSRIQS